MASRVQEEEEAEVVAGDGAEVAEAVVEEAEVAEEAE